MKKGIYKCFILSFVALLAFSLIACTEEGKELNTTDNITSEKTEETMPFEYTMIRGNGASYEENDCFYDVFTTMKKLTGTEPEFSYDVDDNGAFLVDSSALILIGFTSYNETAQALSQIGYDEYIIIAIGEKIVVTAWDKGTLKTATNVFRQMLNDSYDGEHFIFNKDLYIKGKNDKLSIIAAAPVFDGGTRSSLSIEDCSDNTWIAITEDATTEEFQSYQTKITDSGYALYTQNTINGNIFYTYTKDEYSIHTYFVEYSGEVRVIAAKDMRLPATQAAAYENNTNSSVIQFGLEIFHAKDSSTPQGGMGYMFQLADGSFLIIDGGDGYTEDAQQIMLQLSKMAPDPQNIKIAAWIFTHGHNDHVGAFRQFAKDYSKNVNVTIESFIFNLTVSEKQTATIGTAVMDRTASYVAQYYPSVPVYKCHTGQKYYIRNAVVEILYTLEDYMPESVGSFGNLPCVVFSVSIEGQKFTFLADTMRVNCDEMCARYGDYLKSDFVQVSHHGLNDDRPEAQNGTEEIYALINPSYALWPSGDDRYEKYKTAPENAFLLNQLNLQKVFVAGSKTTTITLPYLG